jgi:hypothetical protein
MRINQVKQTFGNTLFLQSEQIARLRFPDDFKSTNKARLCNELTQKGELALRDLVTLMQLLPETYTAKLLTSRAFEDFIFRMMQHTIAVDKKSPNAKPVFTKSDATAGVDKDNGQAPYAFRIATFMLNSALREVIKAMPGEFHEPLKQQIYPFVTLINAVANFSQSSQRKDRTPRLYLPFDITPSFALNTFRSSL